MKTFDFNPVDCTWNPAGCIVECRRRADLGFGPEITCSDRPADPSANVGITRYSLDPNQNPSAIPENHAPKLQFGGRRLHLGRDQPA